MRVTYAELGPAEFRPAIGTFIAVYAAAMNPPERMLAGREAILDRHAANPGFRALAAVLVSDDDPADASGGVLAGFTYGFHGAPGQWWHDMVAGALAMSAARSAPWDRPAPWDGPDPSGAPRTAGRNGGLAWLDDSFEVAELHVLPLYQGRGIGRELLLRSTSGRPERTAVLSTADTESRARRLYRGVGFTDLLTGFQFSGSEPPYAVMGARLPLRTAPAPAGVPPDSRSPRSPRPSSW